MGRKPAGGCDGAAGRPGGDAIPTLSREEHHRRLAMSATYVELAWAEWVAARPKKGAAK